MNHQMLRMPEEKMSNEKHAEIGKRFKSLSSKKFFVCLSISFFQWTIASPVCLGQAIKRLL